MRLAETFLLPWTRVIPPRPERTTFTENIHPQVGRNFLQGHQLQLAQIGITLVHLGSLQTLDENFQALEELITLTRLTTSISLGQETGRENQT